MSHDGNEQLVLASQGVRLPRTTAPSRKVVAQRLLRTRRGPALAVVVLTLSSLIVGVFAAPLADAYPGPVATRASSVVTADALPTVQINGVVWSQAIVGNTVFAGGSFTDARPAGAAAGTNTTPRSNLLAYALDTGNLITTFAPTVNGQILAVTASPDGSRIYIGGDFTAVNGVTRNRIAAFSTATGLLIPNFAPNVGGRVKAIFATNDRVYFGGQFSSVTGSGRVRLAAVRATDGGPLSWNPGADYTVNAVVMTPDSSRVIVGGAFQNVAGAPAYGLAALDANSGALLPWAAGDSIRDAGANSAILGLTTDGTSIFGNGYVFGTGGNFEGTFSADPNSGTIKWLEDCHGDTYANYPAGGVVYTVSHAHYCGNIGGYGQSEPKPWAINMHHALAFTNSVTGSANHDPLGYPDWYNQPTPSLINWFPDMAAGTFTGQSQAAWSVTGNGQYVVLGGEFPTVNGIGQQGLVRFAVAPTAPSLRGPMVTGGRFVPTLNAFSPGAVRVGFQANWDQDDVALTYRIVRDANVAAPVYTTTVNSTFWNRPFIGFTDTGLTPGQTYRYRLYVKDPSGNEVIGDTVSIVASGSGSPLSDYANAVISQGAQLYWRLGESSGTTAADWAGASTGTVGTGVSRGAAGAINGDSNTASTFNGTSAGRVVAPTAANAPAVFSVSAWFKTTTTTGGKIVGYGDSATIDSTSYDRHIYMDNAGRINFGVAPRANFSITSPKSYRDGQWHQAVATLGSNGMVLYVDGVKVAGRTDITSAENVWGYWRVGGDAIGSAWPNDPTSDYFNGSIDEVSVYPTVLTLAQVSAQWAASGRSGGAAITPPVAAFTSSSSELTLSYDGSGSSDADGTITSYAWNFGDNAGSTTSTGTHTYAADGTYTVSLTVTDNDGATNTLNKSITVSQTPNTPPVAAFTSGATNLNASFDGSGSADPDGTITSYAWNFGDNTTGTGVQPTHTYSAGNTYNVTLTVTDNRGATNSVTQPITVTPANVSPTAAFTSSVTDLTLDADGSGSSDPDGTIASYAWDFGDNTTDTVAHPAPHTYDVAGTYTVTLTVTDNRGGTGTVSKAITVPTPQNAPPVAAFSSSSADLLANFDGSGSTDSDGSIASYAWNFGDAGTSTLAKPTHAYATAGTYNVTLQVTDNQGATGTITNPVTVTAPVGPTVYAADTFSRTIANAFGSADTGGSWTVAGTTSAYSVTNGTGSMRVATAGLSPYAFLNGVSARDVTATVDITLDKVPTGTGAQTNVILRHIGTSDYRIKVRIMPTSTAVQITKVVSNVETSLVTQTVAGLTYQVGDTLRVKAQVTGSGTSTVSGKVWKVGATEPSAFQATTTDSQSVLQAAGSVGLQDYLASNATNAPLTASFDNFSVQSVTP